MYKKKSTAPKSKTFIFADLFKCAQMNLWYILFDNFIPTSATVSLGIL